MRPALFWGLSGPGVLQVPDSYPAVLEVRTFSERESLRGERFSRVETTEYHRQLFAAKADEVDDAWKDFPGAKMVTEQDPVTKAVTGVFVLMIVYTEWRP